MTERIEKPHAGFSADGYIVDQGRLTDMPYGCRMSDYNGCGWIAAYNLLRCMEKPTPAGEVTAAMERGLPLGGLLGTGFLRVRRYLVLRGLPLRIAPGRRQTLRAAESARGGVLLYRHKLGWHFVAFVRADEAHFRFFNAIAGKTDHVESMDSFLKGHAVLPITALLSIPSKQ